MTRFTYVPLEDRDWLRDAHRRRGAQFTADYTDTLKTLTAEVDAISTTPGGLISIALDAHPSAFKVNGSGLKANQATASPAVVVSFESKHGPVSFRADAYTRLWGRREPWRDNVRAVALTLQALRAVDRYGAADSGEQYGGWLQLEAGTGALPMGGMTRLDAQVVLQETSGLTPGAPGSDDEQRAYRRARAEAHPDRNGGSREQWDRVEQAARVLGVAR